jgi:hypothetical protein
MTGHHHPLTEKHHAVLFALLSRQAGQQLGQPDGIKVIRLAVRHYGEQRGRRMALRALRNGKPLTLETFLQYGEWQSATQEGRSEVVTDGQNLISRVLRCPWNNAWLEAGLNQFGRLYCLEIDHALVRGFNPVLSIAVNQTLSNDDVPCEFVFPGTPLPAEKNPLNEDKVKSWEYHCAHMLRACQDVFYELYGDRGYQVAQKALDEFRDLYGKDLVESILAYQDTDFNL